MGLLGLLLREGKERAEDYAARKELEEKLGRRVTHEELYSIGSHLDAAETGAPPKPLNYTPREASTPFADAKPPMKLTTKLLLFGVPLLLIFVFGVMALKNMPEQSFYGLNPFSPSPPENVFSANVGDFTLAQRPSYHSPSNYSPVPRFEGEYEKGAETVRYIVSVFNDESEAAVAFNKLKETVRGGQNSKIVERSDSRIAVGAMPGWNSDVYFTDGKYLKKINSFNQKSALDFEGFLKNAPPQPVVLLTAEELKQQTPPPTATTTDSSLTVLELLDAYKEPDAANAKYKKKFINVKGTVEVSQRNKNGEWMLGFMRPGSTKPVDGMVVASFDKAKELNVTSVKKGDTVNMKCRVTMNLYKNVMLESCYRF